MASLSLSPVSPGLEVPGYRFFFKFFFFVVRIAINFPHKCTDYEHMDNEYCCQVIYETEKENSLLDLNKDE